MPLWRATPLSCGVGPGQTQGSAPDQLKPAANPSRTSPGERGLHPASRPGAPALAHQAGADLSVAPAGLGALLLDPDVLAVMGGLQKLEADWVEGPDRPVRVGIAGVVGAFGPVAAATSGPRSRQQPATST